MLQRRPGHLPRTLGSNRCRCSRKQDKRAYLLWQHGPVTDAQLGGQQAGHPRTASPTSHIHPRAAGHVLREPYCHHHRPRPSPTVVQVGQSAGAGNSLHNWEWLRRHRTPKSAFSHLQRARQLVDTMFHPPQAKLARKSQPGSLPLALRELRRGLAFQVVSDRDLRLLVVLPSLTHPFDR